MYRVYFLLISNNTDVASLGSNVYPVRVPEFSIGGNGNFLGISMVTLEREVLSACNEESIKKKIKTLERRGEFVIKSFPSGSLTVAHLQSYLDMMEKVYDYKPDVVLLDYPDIMKMSKRDDKRVEVGEIYVELRGLASERNFALVTASQSNRSSMQASIVRDHHASEDISKIATSDNVITINQTDKEKELGLARLYVAKARFSKSGYQVIVSQNYGIGQFCLSSLYHDSHYDTEINRLGESLSGRE